MALSLGTRNVFSVLTQYFRTYYNLLIIFVTLNTSFQIVTMLGKMICTYQRKNLDKGYRINEGCVREIKDQCSHLLKVVDETRLLNR